MAHEATPPGSTVRYPAPSAPDRAQHGDGRYTTGLLPFTITGLEPVKRDLHLETSELILARNDRGRRRQMPDEPVYSRERCEQWH
jgi:hypothetical protein